MTRPADGYLAFHTPRYEYLLAIVERHLPAGGDGVLDIGLSPFTEILRRRLQHPIDTLGLEADAGSGDGRHFPFDLNDLGNSHSRPPDLPSYRLIVFAEVLEHLHTSPLTVLTFLRERLADRGILIIQTPNAASLGKRLKLLGGRNPYEMIREDRNNPGHFREYTAGELRALTARAGFALVELNRGYYFDARFADHNEDGGAGTPRPVVGALKNAIYGALPPFLREGITLVLRNESSAPSH